MKHLYFDTETTGMVQWQERSSHPDQPAVVQFAALLTDDRGNTIASCSMLVNPGKTVVSAEAAKVHGISTSYAKRNGVSAQFLYDVWLNLAGKADVFVGHNVVFDIRIMQIMAAKLKRDAVAIPKSQRFCTMHSSTKLVNLPPTAKQVAAGQVRAKKVPTLTECVRFFFNEEHDEAHDALADVMACKRIHTRLQESGK